MRVIRLGPPFFVVCLFPFVAVGQDAVGPSPDVADAADRSSTDVGPPDAEPKAVVPAGSEPLAPVDWPSMDRLDPTLPLDEGTRLRIFKQAEQRVTEANRAREESRLREQRVLRQSEDLELRFKALRALQTEFTSALAVEEEKRTKAEKAAAEVREVVTSKQAVEDEKEVEKRKDAVDKLSRVFDKMKAKETAKVVPEMDEDLVVEVLNRLKEKQAAKILAEVEPALAARLSEKIARLRKKQKTNPK